MVPHSATPQSCAHGAQRATHPVAPALPAGRTRDRLQHARFRLVRGHGGAVPLVCGRIRLQAGQEVRVKLHAFSVHLHADPFVGTVHACQVAAVGL